MHVLKIQFSVPEEPMVPNVFPEHLHPCVRRYWIAMFGREIDFPRWSAETVVCAGEECSNESLCWI